MKITACEIHMKDTKHRHNNANEKSTIHAKLHKSTTNSIVTKIENALQTYYYSRNRHTDSALSSGLRQVRSQ